ncbi:MAG: hypothetical protein CFE26_05520 [Verrucomicrobiales bacterium VVV1]|nr:MAG: hypothetical protein CFE26_05520 [Verrucomicrobiales bacterium VVV1]
MFLMNNVHEDSPVLFHVRWVMSYLTGPLTRTQIKSLMDPERGGFSTAGVKQPVAAPDNPMAMPGVAEVETPKGSRPVVGAGVVEKFAAPASSDREVTYRPTLLRVATVHFSSTKAGSDVSRTVRFVNPITPEGITWDTNLPPPLKPELLGNEPEAAAGFDPLPGFAMNGANYKQVEKDFAEWLYRNERAELFSCPALKAWSNIGELEADFRQRLNLQAREARDAALDKLKDAAAKKIAAVESKLQTAEGQLAKEKAQAQSAQLNAGASVLGGILGAVFGRKAGLGSITRGASAFGKATSAYQQHQDVNVVQGKIDALGQDLEAIKAELEEESNKLAASYDPAALTLESDSVKPAKTDIKVESIALLWLPYDADGAKAW